MKKIFDYNEIVWCTLGVLVSILLRLVTNLHPYSGQGKPPMFGDYEAQRHWMEITLNLPTNQWYHNTTENNLDYWGLDYPPLTAYHSYLCGVIGYLINPDYVRLGKSRGYESEDHKFFMRCTVILADLCIYIPGIILYFIVTKGLYTIDTNFIKPVGKSKKGKQHQEEFPFRCGIILALLYPGLILIDHGHFQYNCISLGFAVLAVTFLCMKKEVLSTVFFCLALNYKQMELYHAFPFFLYLLSSCIPKPGQHYIHGLLKLTKLGVTVIVTFGILWYPFLFNIHDLLQVIHRLFPIARGVFEDKVANVWCCLNIIYKFKSYCPSRMVRYCTIATLASILPSSCDLFLRPNIQKFVPALINSALGFFLFSFQVHEKTILLAAVPAVLYLPQKPTMCFWFLFITNFSMLPLFIKDNLVIAFGALTIFYALSFLFSHERWGIDLKSDNTFYMFYKEVMNVIAGAQTNKRSYIDIFGIAYRHIVGNRNVLKQLALYLSLLVSLFGCVILTVVTLTLRPPANYPDLFPLLISVYSCVHFICFFVYFNVVQFKIPQSFDEVQIKMKQS